MSLKKISKIFNFNSSSSSSPKKAPEENVMEMEKKESPRNNEISTSIDQTATPLRNEESVRNEEKQNLVEEIIDHKEKTTIIAPSQTTFSSRLSKQNTRTYDLNMVEKIQIGKKFQLSMEEISTLTTASLKADLISLEIRLLDISPLELRTKIEPLFDLDPLLHSTITSSRNRKSLDRRISFRRSFSASALALALSQSPPNDPIDVSRLSLSARSASSDRSYPPSLSSSHGLNDHQNGSNHSSMMIAKQLFPSDSIDFPIKQLTKQEERSRQRKEITQQSESSWKSSVPRTRSVNNKSIPKLTDTHSAHSLSDSREVKKSTENSSLSGGISSNSISSSKSTRSIHSNSSQDPPKHSTALQSAAQKAVAIFTTRISAKKTPKTIEDDSSSQSSATKRRTASGTTGTTLTTTPSDLAKRNSQTSYIPKTPGTSTASISSSSSSSLNKTKTPNSTLRSSSITSSSSSTISTTTTTHNTSSMGVQRSGSGSSSNSFSSAPPSIATQRKSFDLTLTKNTNTTSTLKSTAVIKPSSNHHFKPKSVTISNTSIDKQQKPTTAPPTLRGGGGAAAAAKNSKFESQSSSSSVSASSSTPVTTTAVAATTAIGPTVTTKISNNFTAADNISTFSRQKNAERVKPTVSINSLHLKKSSSTDERNREIKQHTSTATVSSSSSGTSRSEKISQSQSISHPSSSTSQTPAPLPTEPAMNPFGALISKTPPREEL